MKFNFFPTTNRYIILFFKAFGRLITFGQNKFGQLGVGDCKVRHNINIIGGSLTSLHVINVACGDSFTVCATQENHVFSWGNMSNGRLGLDFSLHRLDTNIICSPRPIFGSLYLVSDMCSRFWNSIIIVEKIIDAKALRSISHNSRNVSTPNSTAQIGSVFDSDYATMDKCELNLDEIIEEKISRPSVFDNIPECSQIARSIQSNNLPDWLKNDLADAEFIPIKALDNENEDKTSSENMLENLNEVTVNVLAKKLKILNILKFFYPY